MALPDPLPLRQLPYLLKKAFLAGLALAKAQAMSPRPISFPPARIVNEAFEKFMCDLLRSPDDAPRNRIQDDD